jgi:hypothetical protein
LKFLIRSKQPTANEPAPGNALDFLQSIYRNPVQPLPTRMRAAMIALPFESPKLSASAIIHPDDFALALEKCIQRSGVMSWPLKLIEHQPAPKERAGP